MSEEIVQIISFCILRKIINVVAYGVGLGEDVVKSFGKCSYCLRGEFLLDTLMMVFFCMLWFIFCCILLLLRNQILLLLHRDLVKVSIVFCCSYWGRWG